MARPKSPPPAAIEREGTASPASDQPNNDPLEEEINTSLADVMDLMAQEVERLKVSLETLRVSRHPDRDTLIRWHVEQIDLRQDRLESLQRMLPMTEEADDEADGEHPTLH